MRNYIILNDQNSNDISGLLIQSLAPISKPLMRTEIEEIDGRDGDIITPLGFSAYDKQITIGLYGTYDINAIIAFFNSEGTVTFSNEPDKYYNYQIYDQIDFERLVRFKTATVTLHCQPFKFATTGESQTLSSGNPISDEGTNLVLEGSQLAPFSQFGLKGNTEQDGTPTPSSPVAVKVVTGENTVKINGKNLYNFRDVTYKSTTFTADDDGWLTCTLNTAPSSNSDQAYYTHNLALKNSTQYAVVLEVKSISGSGTLDVYSRWTGNQEGQFTTEKPVNFSELQAGKTYVYTPTTYASFNYDVGLRTYVRFAAGQTGSITFRLSVLADTNITADTFSYEPYQGQNYTVGLFGSKNIFDKDNANIYNGYMGDNSITAAANARALYIPVSAGQIYTFTRANNNYQVSDFGYCFITDTPTNEKAYIDGRHIVGSSALTFTATAPAGAKYMLIYFAWNPSAEQLATILSTYQIEYGSTSSAYEAYQGIELCKIGDYQDYIWKDGDTWKVHKATGKQTLASGDITLVDSYSNVRYAAFPKTSDNIQNGNYDYGDIVNFFSAARNMGGMPSGGWNTYNADGEVYNNATRTAWWCSFSKSTTLATMQEKLNGMVVYHVLATPTDTAITNTALIEQLDAIANQAHAYKTRTHVSSLYATGNVPHVIAATVVGSADGTITNAGNIYSKPKLTVYGSGDIGIYLNGVQMFQIALGSDGYITIDTNLMEAYKDNLQTLKNRQVTGDYSNFKLPVGQSTISFSGIVTSCVVENFSRWL